MELGPIQLLDSETALFTTPTRLLVRCDPVTLQIKSKNDVDEEP